MSPVRLGPVTSTNEGGNASDPDPRVRSTSAGAANKMFTLRTQRWTLGNNEAVRPPAAPLSSTTDPVAAMPATAPVTPRPAAAAASTVAGPTGTPRAARRSPTPRGRGLREVTTGRPPSSSTRRSRRVVGHVAVDDVAHALGVGDGGGERADEVVGIDVAVAGKRHRLARLARRRGRVDRVDGDAAGQPGPRRGEEGRTVADLATRAGGRRHRPARQRSRKRSPAGRGTVRPAAQARPTGRWPARSAAHRPHVAARVVAS